MFLEAAGGHSGYRPDEEIGRARATGIPRWLPARFLLRRRSLPRESCWSFISAGEAEAKRMLAIANAANTQSIVTPRTEICVIGPTF
jgi:hypothetical protein